MFAALETNIFEINSLEFGVGPKTQKTPKHLLYFEYPVSNQKDSLREGNCNCSLPED